MPAGGKEMKPIIRRTNADGALRSRFFSFFLAFGFILFIFSPAHSATVSGTVTIPDSDMGYKPNLYAISSLVRVEGTGISANIAVVNRYEGTFSLPDVPLGTVTLLFVEGTTDIFTQASKRVQVEVNGDVPGVVFNLVYHWKGLAGYPPNWQTTGYVDEWVPHFVSDQVGFMLFRVRGSGIDPERVELYRTIDGGQSWEEIGHWLYEASPYPDFLNRYLYFADQDRGVIPDLVEVGPGYQGRGVLYTSDGGENWSHIDFPNPPEEGVSEVIQIHRFAGIDESHWIACGKNAGTSAFGDPQYNVIWETGNGGASWEIKLYWQEAGSCTGLGADANGRAIAFFTPYAWGGEKKVVLRDPSGTWTRIDDNQIITNSGYGPADIPMVGDTAWVRNTQYDALSAGLYRSSNAGLEWERISDALPQYMDFATENKGFGPAGGPMYVTYDGGVTWLYQSGGGGSCCHGNNVWAFDTTHAVWHEAGVGNPNDVPEIFTYVEPWEANFEAAPGVSLTAGFFIPGARNVPLSSYKLLNHGPVPIRIDGLTLRASGTGNDRRDILQVKLWHDRNANGSVDAGDLLLGQGAFPADDGSVSFSFEEGPILSQLLPFYLLVTYDLRLGISLQKTFVCTLTANEVEARRTDTDDPILPTAPPNYPLPGRVVTITEKMDFNRDGKADLLWRNASAGRTTIWYMDGATWTGEYADILPAVTDSNWSVIGVADFNGDNNPDLLWRDSSTGRVVIWYMNGPTWNGGYSEVLSSTADLNWTLAGIADFNWDNNPDLLWRNNATGQTIVCYMNGGTWEGEYADILPAITDSNWSIVGAADFNGDGNPDLLWKDGLIGRMTIWYMNGAAWNGEYADVLPTVSDPAWQIAAIRDFNHDGSPDLLWRKTGGNPGDPDAYRMTVWFMDGPIWNGAYADLLPVVGDSQWVIVGK
jgi:hypothetical protein